jgi:hypothetical protein
MRRWWMIIRFNVSSSRVERRLGLYARFLGVD